MDCSCSTWARRGVFAAEEIGKAIGYPIAKALDPLDPDDFITLSVRLARALRGAAVGLEGEALKSAIQTLDVDWSAISEARRDAVIKAARAEVLGLADTVAPVVEPVLFSSASSLVPLSRKAAISRFDLTIGAGSDSWVKGIVGDLRDSQMVYVRDSYGQRADRFDKVARDVVASGMERGLGRDDISEELSNQLTPLGVERGTNYWNLIATDFSNKSRTISQLNTFTDSGIELYIYDAVLDEATSEICRLLHGRTFSVKKAAKRMNAALALRDPLDIRNAMPWVQADANKLYFQRGETRHDIATVQEFGEGEKDRIGKYSNVMSRAALEKAGVTVPPRHGHCRSNLIAAL